MTNYPEPLRGYLEDLRHALRDTKVSDADSIVADIESHIDEWMSENKSPSTNELAALIAELGPPDLIAEEAVSPRAFVRRGRASGRRRRIVIRTAALGIAVALMTLGYIATQQPAPNQTRVLAPSVVGMTLARAEATLSEHGLWYNVHTTVNSASPHSVVVAQGASTRASKSLPLGTAVDVWTS